MLTFEVSQMRASGPIRNHLFPAAVLPDQSTCSSFYTEAIKSHFYHQSTCSTHAQTRLLLLHIYSRLPAIRQDIVIASTHSLEITHIFSSQPTSATHIPHHDYRISKTDGSHTH